MKFKLSDIQLNEKTLFGCGSNLIDSGISSLFNNVCAFTSAKKDAAIVEVFNFGKGDVEK